MLSPKFFDVRWISLLSLTQWQAKLARLHMLPESLTAERLQTQFQRTAEGHMLKAYFARTARLSRAPARQSTLRSAGKHIRC